MRVPWISLLVPALVVVLVWLALTERLPAWLVGANEIAVNTLRVQKRMVPMTVRSDGILKPANESKIFPRLAGRITELRFKVGDPIPAGAMVATIYSNEMAQRQIDLEAAVAVAQKELKQKESEFAAAQSLAVQRRDLLKQDLIARREFEQAEAAAQTARAGTEWARAQLSQQESMLAQIRKIGTLTQVSAPVGGVVIRRLVEVGATVGTATPIMVVASDRSVKFSGTISSRTARELRPGLKAMISSPSAPGKMFDGLVRNLTPSDDANDATLDIEIRGEKNALELVDGTKAQALVFLDRLESVLSLPRTVIFASAGKNYVLKIVAERAVRQEVVLGVIVDGDIVINGGVNENDLVIFGHPESIQAGRRVRSLPKTSAAN